MCPKEAAITDDPEGSPAPFTCFSAFIEICGLVTASATVGLRAIGALHSAVKGVFPRSSGFEYQSAATGAIVVVSDEGQSRIHERLPELARRARQQRVPIRVGLSHGSPMRVRDFDGMTNFIGESITTAARLARSPRNDGCLADARYVANTAHSGRLFTVRGKGEERYRCVSVALKVLDRLQAVPETAAQAPGGSGAVMIAYDLPKFGAGDTHAATIRSLLLGRVVEELRSRCLPGVRIYYSPGGDGGILVIPGIDKLLGYLVAQLLPDILDVQSRALQPGYKVQCRLGIHYARVSFYKAAMGVDRPFGPALFALEDLINDRVARGRDGLIVTGEYEAVYLGNRGIFKEWFERLPRAPKGPARDVERYRKRGLPGAEADAAATGAVPYAMIDRRKRKQRRLPGETFAIEMLARPVLLARTGSALQVKIDRRDVAQYAISNEGKTKFIREYAPAQRYELLKQKDREIQEFLLGKSAASHYSIDLQDLKIRLRWASGGVLSIVKWKGEFWVPGFFRDIRPYGWNISLGSAERCFNHDRSVRDPGQLEAELCHPEKFILREFQEEAQFIDGPPAANALRRYRRFTAPELGTTGSDAFGRRHAELRRADGFTIETGGRDLPVKFVPGLPAEVQITSPRGTLVRPSTKNVLVCFSLLDLGIEVVRVATYDLLDADYFLDGEVLAGDELVRMPTALLSIGYLERVFGRGEIAGTYTPGIAPSIKAASPPKRDEIYPFPWDILRRSAIVAGDVEATASVYDRYLDWFDKFKGDFGLDKRRTSITCRSDLFVPGTAKIINLFFHSEAAQSLRKDE